jgi:hypothetical protein
MFHEARHKTKFIVIDVRFLVENGVGDRPFKKIDIEIAGGIHCCGERYAKGE